MTQTVFRWKFPDPVPTHISKKLDSFSPPFRSILFHRGCTNIDDAVNLLLPQKPSYSDRQQLRHLDLACDLIQSAISNAQKIAVYGDYDADGITATALLTLALQKLSNKVIPFIPNRINDGYGLNEASIDILHQQGVELLITVDNGIRSFSEIAHAKSLGMNIIIINHHQPSSLLPDSDAIINPKIPDDPYPNKNLAGVGVAYKLVCALAEHFTQLSPEDYLDLVAIGTIADIVPLSGENRFLVKQGLIKINQKPRQSLFSLIGAAGLSGRQISSSDISFQIAPRLNASGRLAATENHLVPLELLLSTDPVNCGNLAQILDNHNDRRKQVSRLMLDRIESEFATLDSLPSILISLDSENDLGVAGIAAGSLTNKYYLPSIVGAIGQNTTTASCRSIPEFDIISVLNANKDLFTHFGGHKSAAGFTIENRNLPTLQNRLLEVADKEFSGLDISPTLDIDAVVTLSELDNNLYQELLKLEPTGEGNPPPLFAIRNLIAKHKSKVGKNQEHLKLVVSDGTNSMPAIAFGFGSILNSLPDTFQVAGYFSENEFRGNKEFQLRLADIKPLD